MTSSKQIIQRTLLQYLPIHVTLVCMAFFVSTCQSTPNHPYPIPTTSLGDGTAIKETKIPTVTHTPAATPTPIPTSQFDIESSSLNGLNLTLWYFASGAEGKTITTLVNEFNKTNSYHYSVDATLKGGVDDLFSELDHALTTTGKIPDLTIGFSYQAQQWEKTRPVILDQNPFILDPIWGLSQSEIEAIHPMIYYSDVVSDKRWGFPAWRSGEVLFYNQTWASELGFKQPPTSLTDFKKQVCAGASDYAKKHDANINGKGGLIISTNYSSNLVWQLAFEAKIIKPDNKGYQFNTTATEKAFTYLRNLYDEQCSWLPQNQPPNSEFAHRQGLFLSASMTDIPHIIEEFSKAGNTDRWTIVPFPSSSNQPLISIYGPSYIQFQSQLPRELASWLFIKWMILPENQIRLAKASFSIPIYHSEMVKEYIQEGDSQTWLDAIELVSNSVHEPTIGSWYNVRWTIADANRQLYQWYFEADQIPSMIKLLDQTANDLHKK